MCYYTRYRAVAVAANTQGNKTGGACLCIYHFDTGIILEPAMTTLKKLLYSLTLLELEPITEIHIWLPQGFDKFAFFGLFLFLFVMLNLSLKRLFAYIIVTICFQKCRRYS